MNPITESNITPQDATLDERIEEFAQLGILTGERLVLLVKWDSEALRRAFGRHTQRLAEYQAEYRVKGGPRLAQLKSTIREYDSMAGRTVARWTAEHESRISDLTLRIEAVAEALRLSKLNATELLDAIRAASTLAELDALLTKVDDAAASEIVRNVLRTAGSDEASRLSAQ